MAKTREALHAVARNKTFANDFTTIKCAIVVLLLSVIFTDITIITAPAAIPFYDNK